MTATQAESAGYEGYEPEPEDEPKPTAGYRTYEVYQRERVGQTTNLIKPIKLVSEDYATDPYPLVEILRENYPCFRDWLGNRFWITRYDDVTSVFSDDANYETRSKRWYYGEPEMGRNLGDELPVLWARANRLGASFDDSLTRVIDDITASRATGSADLASDFAARVPIEAWAHVLDLPKANLPEFAQRYWRMQRGTKWDARSQHDGRAAIDELVEYFTPLIDARRADPGDDLVSAVAGLELPGGPATAIDLVVTLLEFDHETLHGALANLWFQLLTNPEQLEIVKADRRMMKFAYLETLRHSPPVLSADRFAKHEVERFGRLIPAGALMHCSAAAANRDPRQFADPDTFRVDRADMCQREPRGQYRADGLPAGIAFGMGRPSPHPAVPKGRPVSEFALTRDLAVRASNLLLDAVPDISLSDRALSDIALSDRALAAGAAPALRSLRIGEMHTCWSLPI